MPPRLTLIITLCCFLLPAAPLGASGRLYAFTAQDMADLACSKDCYHRDYQSGFALPTGACRCFDDHAPSALAKPFVTIPRNLRGRVIIDPKPHTPTEF